MPFEKPIIAINFKTYNNALGEKAVEIAKAIEEVNPDKSKYDAVLCPQSVDIRLLTSATKFPVFAQHADAFKQGRNTGYNIISSIKNAGASGLIINHSEHKLLLDAIEKTILMAKKLNLQTICCADSIDQARAIACFSPDYVAVEPPELIGTDISLAKKDPELIKKIIKKIKFINPLVRILIGAGIKTRKDVNICTGYGANGVLLASGVICAKNMADVLFDLFG